MMNKYKIFDAHCDTLCRLADLGGTISKNTYNVDIESTTGYESYTQVFACFIAPEYDDNAKDRFKKLKECYDMQNFRGIRPMLSLEGGMMIKSLEDVEYLKSCGVRCAALTWNFSNHIAGGVLGEGRLTEFGKSVVRKMNDIDILVDVSHLNDKSFYDVAKISTKPIIATHSNSRHCCCHPRNLTDDMFNIIKDSGGCVGMNFYPMFVTNTTQCTVYDIVRHIDHFMSLDGENSVGIGSDFDGTDDCLPDEIKNCGDTYKLLDKLADGGYGTELTEKISHLNFKRVFGEVE